MSPFIQQIISLTQREPEARETWRSMDEVAVNEFKTTSICKDWDFGAKELVRDATDVVKVSCLAI
jgi:salicylate hydroxylase